MATSAPLHAARVPEDAVGEQIEAPCSVLQNLVSCGGKRQALDERMHGVLRNEVGHMRRQRSARGVDLHALAQPAAVLSHKAIVDDLFVQGDLIDFVVGGSYVSTIFHSSVERERVNRVERERVNSCRAWVSINFR